MLYTMKLKQEPFEKIRNGSKTIELRIYDEKRQQVQIGDFIEFSLMDTTFQEIRESPNKKQWKKRTDPYFCYVCESHRKWQKIFQRVTASQEGSGIPEDFYQTNPQRKNRNKAAMS